MVGTDIKSFVKHLKLSVQVKEKFLSYLTYGTSGGEFHNELVVHVNNQRYCAFCQLLK